MNTGIATTWGATNSNRVIDASSEVGTYDYGNITNSINFIPNSSGIYTYWNNAGGSSQIKASKLINEDMFTSLLGFNGTDIWDFTSLNMTKRVYPDLRWKTSSGK